MRTLLAVLMVALAAAPAAAQRGKVHFGLALASLHHHVWEDTKSGFYGGVSFDVRDHFRLGALYVQRGSGGYRVHSIEVPVLYRRGLGDITLTAGPAFSYADYPDVGAMVGLSVRGRDYPVGAEVAFVYGLLPDRNCCTGGVTLPGHRVLRIGLEVPLR